MVIWLGGRLGVTGYFHTWFYDKTSTFNSINITDYIASIYLQHIQTANKQLPTTRDYYTSGWVAKRASLRRWNSQKMVDSPMSN